MSAINATVTGNLVADPELKFTPNGVPVVTFTVAANERRKNGDKWEDGPVSFVRCNAWRDLAEHIAESLAKGDRLVVTGAFREREWETTPTGPNDTGKRRTWELTAAEVGAALTYATVKIAKATRRGDEPPVPEDPWQAEEPPF